MKFTLSLLLFFSCSKGFKSSVLSFTGSSNSNNEKPKDDKNPPTVPENYVYNLNLESRLSVENSGHPVVTVGGICANDIWGWTDPQTNKEYALLATTTKVAVIDVSAPQSPVHIADIISAAPTPSGDSRWRDVKTYGNYAVIVSEEADHGLQIFNLSELRGLNGNEVVLFPAANIPRYTGFGNAHNVIVNEQSQHVYITGSTQNSANYNLCDFSLHAINMTDPSNPQFAGCISANIASGGTQGRIEGANSQGPTFNECTNRNDKTKAVFGPKIQHDQNDSCGRFYTHDAHCVIYNGPDVEHRGKEICAVSNGPISNEGDGNPNDYHFIDVTNKQSPVLLSTYTISENSGYAHQGWFTSDQRYFVANDELDEVDFGVKTRTIIIDASDLDNVKHHMYHFHDSNAVDHNLYVKEGRIYHSNYTSGLWVYDISDIANKNYKLLANYDTNPNSDMPEFLGNWSNYPFFKSGTVVASKIETCEALIFKEEFVKEE